MLQLSILHKGVRQKIQIYGARSVERVPGALIKAGRGARARAKPCCFYTDFAVTITTVR